MKLVFTMLLLISIQIFPQKLNQTPPEPEAPATIDDLVGDWVGTGWGWEIRFKQKAKDFAKQFTKGKVDFAGENEEIIMSLMVTHVTNFYFSVDSTGSVKGYGTITYDLIPNLCGVAALTKQVNEMVNMMSVMPTIFKWASQINKSFTKYFNNEWFQKEANLVRKLDEFQTITKEFGNYKGPKPLLPAEIKNFITQYYKDMGNPTEVKDLAGLIMFNRCATGNAALGNKLACTLIQSVPVPSDAKGLGDALLDKLVQTALKKIASEVKSKVKALNLDEQKSEQICLCGAGASTAAGTKVGPTTIGELAIQFGPEIAKAAIFDAAFGSLPVGLMLSIPGVTQVQYYYKGLKDGPENRGFKIKGNVEITGGTPRLRLSMDGDVEDGDKNLTVEYMVNYKKENPTFPAWTPFRNDPAKMFLSGTETIYERKTVMKTKEFKDKATGKTVTIEIPEEVTTSTDIFLNFPFADFRETGTKRDNKSMWHEYEYVWRAHRVAAPLKND